MCEGITDKCNINLLFASVEERRLHREQYCNLAYKDCMIFKMLDAKYDG